MTDDMSFWCGDVGQASARVTYNYIRIGVVWRVTERPMKVNEPWSVEEVRTR